MMRFCYKKTISRQNWISAHDQVLWLYLRALRIHCTYPIRLKFDKIRIRIRFTLWWSKEVWQETIGRKRTVIFQVLHM